MKLRHLILPLALLGTASILIGCDKEVSHEKKVKVKDGEVTTKETTVKETPEGNITVEEKTTETQDGKTNTETTTKEYKAPQP